MNIKRKSTSVLRNVTGLDEGGMVVYLLNVSDIILISKLGMR